MRPFVPIDYFVVLDRSQKGVGVEIERVGKKKFTSEQSNTKFTTPYLLHQPLLQITQFGPYPRSDPGCGIPSVNNLFTLSTYSLRQFLIDYLFTFPPRQPKIFFVLSSVIYEVIHETRMQIHSLAIMDRKRYNFRMTNWYGYTGYRHTTKPCYTSRVLPSDVLGAVSRKMSSEGNLGRLIPISFTSFTGYPPLMLLCFKRTHVQLITSYCISLHSGSDHKKEIIICLSSNQMV